ncbi:MAG TPA: HEAT repeat domain-containing protein [Bryobacteraceae bacterium]
MNCHVAQANLSAYLYGELDFAAEEDLEQHLNGCAFCQRALDSEKAWHTALNAERRDVPLDLLAHCRQELRSALSSEMKWSAVRPWWKRWFDGLDFATHRWSWQIAMASFLVFVGFAFARWVDRNGLSGGLKPEGVSFMSMLNPGSHIRDIQPDDAGNVRITLEQVRQGEVTGSVTDENVRRLLLAATRESADPGIRVYSVEILTNQGGSDVRDALLNSVLHDPNAAVRLKAIEGLQRFAADSASRSALRYVLEHDSNPGVRSQAIEILAPRQGPVTLTPELANTLQDVVRSADSDDYVRTRCLELLREVNAPVDVY